MVVDFTQVKAIYDKNGNSILKWYSQTGELLWEYSAEEPTIEPTEPDNGVTYNYNFKRWYIDNAFTAKQENLYGKDVWEKWNKYTYCKYVSPTFESGIRNCTISFHGFFRDGNYFDNYEQTIDFKICVYDSNNTLVNIYNSQLLKIDDYGVDAAERINAYTEPAGTYHSNVKNNYNKYVPDNIYTGSLIFIYSESPINTVSNVTVPAGGHFEIKMNTYNSDSFTFNYGSWLFMDADVYLNGEKIEE